MASVLEDNSDFNPLFDFEKQWVARYDFLSKFGYTLRPRYHPRHTPTSARLGIPAYKCEDNISAPLRPSLMDALDVEGRRVYIKRLHHKDNEMNIVKLLSPEGAVLAPQNHTVPIVKILRPLATGTSVKLPPGDDEHTVYLVMPFLFQVDDVPFESVFQIVDFVEQLLEGLVYMHAQGVAHRDCSVRNIMMDAYALFPKGFHPVHRETLPDGIHDAPRRPRSTAPIRYYYIDFGISSHFDSIREQNRNVLGEDGIDREVPELSTKVPYDPFKVDIFLIGNVFKHEVYEKYKNIEFLEPLIQSMTAKDPSARPDASQAYEQWTQLRTQLSTTGKVWRVKARSESTVAGFFLDTFTAIRLVVTFPIRIAAKLLPSSLRRSPRAPPLFPPPPRSPTPPSQRFTTPPQCPASQPESPVTLPQADTIIT